MLVEGSNLAPIGLYSSLLTALDRIRFREGGAIEVVGTSRGNITVLTDRDDRYYLVEWWEVE